MYASNRASISSPAAVPWTLDPSSARVNAIDRALRKRLAKSLRYIAEVARERNATALGDIDELERRLAAGCVSPWVYYLYSKLVAELSKRATAEIISGVFADVVQAASLLSTPGTTTTRSCSTRIGSAPSDPRVPIVRCSLTASGTSLALLEGGDPNFSAELSNLLRMVVLAAPSGSHGSFNGASTFFVWGGALFNAALSRSPITMIDVLVHESSHVLLFGLSANGSLTTNSGDERYASPVRSDKRPIDGIFHACFVTTRVHLAMGRLLATGTLDSKDASEAKKRRRYNGDAARESLELLERHAGLTANGESIYRDLQAYWDAGRTPHAS